VHPAHPSLILDRCRSCGASDEERSCRAAEGQLDAGASAVGVALGTCCPSHVPLVHPTNVSRLARSTRGGLCDPSTTKPRSPPTNGRNEDDSHSGAPQRVRLCARRPTPALAIHLHISIFILQLIIEHVVALRTASNLLHRDSPPPSSLYHSPPALDYPRSLPLSPTTPCPTTCALPRPHDALQPSSLVVRTRTTRCSSERRLGRQCRARSFPRISLESHGFESHKRTGRRAEWGKGIGGSDEGEGEEGG
jgi:hypothetical protein